MKSPGAVVRLALAGATLLLPLRVDAQDDTTRPAAMALFDEGRQLMASGKHADACPKFEAAIRLVRSPGIRLNLADCLEKTGRTASAWAQFREAAAEALRAGRQVEEQEARRRLSALEPKLTKLVIVVPTDHRVDGLSIERDGAAVAPAAWDNGVPVDPGSHTVEATAPRKERWKSSVDVLGEGKTISIDVPALRDAAPAAASRPPSGPAPTDVATAPPSTAAPGSVPETVPPATNSRLAAVLVTGGVGLVGVGIGVGFGLSAKAAYNHDVDVCDRTNVCDASDAKRAGLISTVAFAVGATGLVAGALILLTAPKGTPGSVSWWLAPRAGGGFGGLATGGSF